MKKYIILAIIAVIFSTQGAYASVSNQKIEIIKSVLKSLSIDDDKINQIVKILKKEDKPSKVKKIIEYKQIKENPRPLACSSNYGRLSPCAQA